MLSIRKRFLVIFFLLPLASFNLYAETVKLRIGEPVPAYLGIDEAGTEVRIDDLKGKVVIVSFWASWCGPCLQELPILENIQQTLGSDVIKVVAVNFKEDRKRYKKLLKKLSGISLTLTHDKRGVISKRYGVESLPHLFLIHKNGNLAYETLGYGSQSTALLVDEVNRVLAL